MITQSTAFVVSGELSRQSSGKYLDLGSTDEMISAGRRYVMKDPSPHPGITMHKIPVGGGVAGLIFTLGSVAIFLAGFPAFWYVVVLSIGMGIGIATLLHFLRN